ncbi:MAG: hypothetical protein RBT45_04795 [Acholeplasmataceae bacterium]|nr:hypothetical protein [Acholeplasmataceae bacterium]
MKKLMVVIGAIALIGLGFMLGRRSIPSYDELDFNQETESSMQALNVGVSEIEDTNLDQDKLEVFLNLHDELLTAHQILFEKHQAIKHLREEIQTARSNFRELGVRLNREDGATLWYYNNDLLDLKEEFEGTYGLAYKRLADLKGSYTIENADLIIQTFEEVIVVLNNRIDMLNQGIVIFNQSILIYNNYLN